MFINKLDGKALREIKARMDKELKKVADEFGIDIVVGNSRYDSLEATIKVSLKVKDNGEGKGADKVEWEKYAEQHGLEKGWFGKKFEYMGKEHTVIGLKHRRRIYPVLTETEDGKKVCFSRRLIKECLYGK